MIDYNCCIGKGTSEVVEKKSRFLGELVPCHSQEEAEAYIAGVRKKHYDARHHCFAWVCGQPGTPEEIRRSSDDGEPQGTAGKPLLDILDGNDLHESLLIVTRYFGGTLLGTGGLVRAYGAAGAEALKNAQIGRMCACALIRVSCSYTACGKLRYLFAAEGWTTEETDFGEDVTITLVVPAADELRARNLITEATAGGARMGETEAVTRCLETRE